MSAKSNLNYYYVDYVYLLFCGSYKWLSFLNVANIFVLQLLLLSVATFGFQQSILATTIFSYFGL